MDLIDALRSIDKPHEDDVLNRLFTPWGENLDKDHVLSEYPRPQFVRDSYINLNGYWDYCIVPAPTEFDNKSLNDSFASQIPSQMDGQILVPFSPEAMLSGVERRLEPDQFLWYKRALPTINRKYEDSRILLHFGAVDQFADVYVVGYDDAHSALPVLPQSKVQVLHDGSFVHLGADPFDEAMD